MISTRNKHCFSYILFVLKTQIIFYTLIPTTYYYYK